jgi:hypothetical protein
MKIVLHTRFRRAPPRSITKVPDESRSLRLPSLVRLLNRASDVEVRIHGRNRATVIYRPTSEATRERSPLVCRVRRAQLAAGPTLWNLPVAVLEEAECQALGGDRCVYRVTWVEPTRWWQSLVGGLLFGVPAWLASGHNWLVSIPCTATAVMAVHLWGARRDLREMRTLEDLKRNMLGRIKCLRPTDTLEPSRRDTGIAEALLGEGRVGAPDTGIAPLPQTGQLLAGRYRLGPLLGAGGMGFVFSARDEATDQVVGLKVLRPELSVNPEWVERMEREVRIARMLHDPHVCRVMSFGQVDAYCFLTMELASGSLHHELYGRALPKPWDARVADAKAILGGLVAIHRAGIVHRDLTPRNILRFAEDRLAIADFGLAVDKPGKTTQIAGTPRYIAPEVLGGAKVTYASDVWQLGMTLRELLFGDSADSSATVETNRAAQVLLKLCGDCMIVDPRLRPANAQAVAALFPGFENARPDGRAVEDSAFHAH